MVDLLRILDLGITIFVPAVVWTLLGVGVIQLVRESLHEPRVVHRQMARSTRS